MLAPGGYKVSRDLVREERNNVISYNQICLFCLFHKDGQECYERGTDKKHFCRETGCNEELDKWPHDILMKKKAAVNVAECVNTEGDRRGMVNVVVGCSDRWKTSNAAWKPPRRGRFSS
jgi:hypothetical protein